MIIKCNNDYQNQLIHFLNEQNIIFKQCENYFIIDNIDDLTINILKANRQLICFDETKNYPLVQSVNKHDFPLLIFAGPCSIECDENYHEAVKKLVQIDGLTGIRAGAFKPRTSPYSFQGLQTQAMNIIINAKKVTNLPFICEVTSIESLNQCLNYADILQIGTRNMQNFALLEACGKTNKPIILKRGMGATIDEFLSAAEYILKAGNQKVILCERGIRTFENSTRFTLDISAIPIIKQITNLPIIVDPSHASGKRELVESLSLAAIAAGADGLLIECHQNPDFAYSDGRQAIDFNTLKNIINKSRKIAEIIHEDFKN